MALRVSSGPVGHAGGMLTILALLVIPAVLAAGFDSVGFALIAAAGVIWGMGVYACVIECYKL